MKKLLVTVLCLSSVLLLYAQTPRQADLSLNVIAIDPGHGGKDAGTVSRDKNTKEKDVTLSLARKLSSRIREEYPSMKVILTREKDEFIELNRRARIATDAGAQLFISIHINASAKGTAANGFSAYILGTSNRYNSYDVNMEVCKRENSVIYLEEDYSTKYKDLDESSPESQIFLKLMQNAFREQSLSFAEASCNKMAENGPFKKDLGVLQGNFAVLRQASMPAVLLEFGYMTNDDDLSAIRNEKDIDTMVDNMLSAVRDYKKSYDQSVRIGSRETEDTSDSGKPATVTGGQDTASTQVPANTESEVFYGMQVLASGKLMSAEDKYFRGYPVKAVKTGSLYKYVIIPDLDLSKVKAQTPKVKSQFPDAFLVKVENDLVSRLK